MKKIIPCKVGGFFTKDYFEGFNMLWHTLQFFLNIRPQNSPHSLPLEPAQKTTVLSQQFSNVIRSIDQCQSITKESKDNILSFNWVKINHLTDHSVFWEHILLTFLELKYLFFYEIMVICGSFLKHFYFPK